jgi:hypothetical protein
MSNSEEIASDQHLISQSAARQQARELNEAGDYPAGMVNIAHPVPVNSWGGQEKGWSVSLVMAP